jgi:hypothetical protein
VFLPGGQLRRSLDRRIVGDVTTASTVWIPEQIVNSRKTANAGHFARCMGVN